MSHGCPVLHELEVTEGYQPEHENPPVLSGGDYDVGGIRSCAEECDLAARLRALTIEHNTALALIADRAALTASRDEWRDRAAANAARIEELVRDRDKWRSRAKQSYLDLDSTGKKLTKLCLIARRIRSAFMGEDRPQMSRALQSFFEEADKP